MDKRLLFSVAKWVVYLDVLLDSFHKVFSSRATGVILGNRGSRGLLLKFLG